MNPARRKKLRANALKANSVVVLNLPSSNVVASIITSNAGKDEFSNRELRGKELLDESFKVHPDKLQTIYGI